MTREFNETVPPKRSIEPMPIPSRGFPGTQAVSHHRAGRADGRGNEGSGHKGPVTKPAERHPDTNRNAGEQGQRVDEGQRDVAHLPLEQGVVLHACSAKHEPGTHHNGYPEKARLVIERYEKRRGCHAK